MSDSNKIQIYVTGGTFDKEYNYITGQLYFKDTHLPEMFERGRSTLDVDIKTLMMLDSLQMSEADREIIIYSCKKSDYKRIVLTHGTDTMVQTAAALAKNNIPKTIILTGAMIPYAFGTSSDGFFNLGAALAFAQTLPHGVYIAMNGRYHHWDKVQKNTKTGYFEPI
ncbi:MAG TPA: asparaginase domain-containing protein [Saprospiraceae bacterium]|nr:asparaginase domain-containing protein [Saprospiraceae bacterium]